MNRKRGALILTTISLLALLCISPLAFASYSMSPTSTITFSVSRVNLSNDSGQSVEPYVAAGGSNVYVAWIDSSLSGIYRLYFRASNDNGATFNPLYVVSCPSSNQGCKTAVSKSGNIQIVAEGDHIILVWKQGSGIYESASSDAGATWTAPFDISASLSGTSSSPVDALAGNNVYISWVQSPPGGGLSQIYIVNSSDYGTTINPNPLLISTESGVAFGNEEDSVSASGSCVYAVWDSIWFTRSCSNGDANTWSSPVQIKNACCPHNLSREPMVAANGTNVYITWTSNTNAPTLGIKGPYQAYVFVSNDNGTSFIKENFKWFNLTGDFTAARELQVSTWGNLVAVTYFGQQTTEPVNQWVSVSTDSGNSFLPPHQLLSLTKGEPGFGGVLVYNGNIYTFWPHTAGSKGSTQMYFEASADSGSSWAGSNPSPISNGNSVGMMSNCNNVCDNGPMLAASGSHVYLVWEQIFGTNSEILFSAS